ncbi:MAG TPA: hypothetical protein VMS17_12775, partial [Gemmataceae bacterium]|nr:hypothetical protein [Gemmataceae bacterium]
RRESNVGLIVTLIFFILTSVGLGVATYYGFAQQDALLKDKKASDKAAADMKEKADYYQFQALWLRAIMGLTADFDQPSDPKDATSQTTGSLLKTERDQFDVGTLGKNMADRAVFADLLKNVESGAYTIIPAMKDGKPVAAPQGQPQYVDLAWNPKTTRPNSNFLEIFFGQRALIEDLRNAVASALKLQHDKEDEATTVAKERDDWKQKFTDKEKELQTKDLTVKNQSYTKLVADVNTTLTKAQADFTTEHEARGKAEAELKKANDEVARVNKELLDLKASVNEQQQKLDTSRLEQPAEGKPIPTDWKIVRMDRSGKEPFINLGSAQGVQPGLTFSIHAQGPDGRPVPASKGTLEVLNVVGPDLSQAQIVNVKDSFKNPILPGDYLYNPIFHPGKEQHVAIAGRIDMHGTKGDDLDEFQRVLDRNNVKVDAFLDPKEEKVKGRITVNTDFLILGDIADLKPDSPEAIAVNQLKQDAITNGVHIVSSREFLESMGRKAP